jgi:hypothetical protein
MIKEANIPLEDREENKTIEPSPLREVVVNEAPLEGMK